MERDEATRDKDKRDQSAGTDHWLEMPAFKVHEQDNDAVEGMRLEKRAIN